MIDFICDSVGFSTGATVEQGVGIKVGAPVLNFIKDKQPTGALFSMSVKLWRSTVANEVVGMVVLAS